MRGEVRRLNGDRNLVDLLNLPTSTIDPKTHQWKMQGFTLSAMKKLRSLFCGHPVMRNIRLFDTGLASVVRPFCCEVIALLKQNLRYHWLVVKPKVEHLCFEEQR